MITKIRAATLDDIEQLIELRKLLLNTGCGYYVAQTEEEKRAWQESYYQWLIKNIHQNEKINVIVHNHPIEFNKVVGCAIGIIDERVPFNSCLNGRMGWVQTVVVHPEFRRQGLAEQLMVYLCEWFRNNDVSAVALQATDIAKQLYKNLNFLDSGETLLIKTL